MPDGRALVIAFLLDAGVPEGVDGRVQGRVEVGQTWPVLTVTSVAAMTASLFSMEEQYLQLDVWGQAVDDPDDPGSEQQVRDMMAETRAALFGGLPGRYDAGIVTAVRDRRGPFTRPDPDTGHPRCTSELAVFVKPRATALSS